MKIIIFSSDPRFKLFADNFTQNSIKISLLVTQPPKMQGRFREPKPNAAHAFAIQNNIPVAHPDRLDDNFAGKLAGYNYDLGFIFAYGKIIPRILIDKFPKGIFNIHFSLLPKYVGPSPIQQALLDDEKETGYTIFKITEKLDDGDILSQERTVILPDDNFDSLREKIIARALETLSELLKKYCEGVINLKPMPKTGRSLTKKFTKSDGAITPLDDVASAYNKVRAFSNWPKTYLEINQKRFIVGQAELRNSKLEILQIQPEGKATMSFLDFKNGYPNLLTKFPDFVNIS